MLIPHSILMTGAPGANLLAPKYINDQRAALNAIDELRQHCAWVSWKRVPRQLADGTWSFTKPPVDPHTGRGASHTNPATWGTYDEARKRTRAQKLAGVGFVLSEDDDYTGYDLDKCRDEVTGEIEPWAMDIIALAETYAEVSPSGTGIRLIARGKVEKTIKCDAAHVEIYRSQRYLTITQDHIEGTPLDIRPAPMTYGMLVGRVEDFRPKPAYDQTSHVPEASTVRAKAPNLSAGTNFFRNVNDKALSMLGAWVTAIFPAAKFQQGTGGYRVYSRDLGRSLEEDLSFSPHGIKDFGVADMGDTRQGARTAIDIVMAYSDEATPVDAAFWLCERMGVLPDQLGWQVEQASDDRRDTIIIDNVMVDAETGEIVEDRSGSAREYSLSKADNPAKLETVVASSFEGMAVPKQSWLVENLIPEANVTILSGDGATGKSLLALQLAIATATGGMWIGYKPTPGRVLFVSAEDELGELHRRLDQIVPDLASLTRLVLVPLAGKDAVLAAPTGRDGLLKPTPVFEALRQTIMQHQPNVLILDTLADLFGGDEIKKIHARQFIGQLRGLALEFNLTILLLSHPSQAGMTSGSGTSGNTAWNNSVRSRLYFERRVNKFDGGEDDADIRVLTTKKANRAASGGKIVVRYDNGQFVREKGCDLNTRDLNRQADNVFIALLTQFTVEGRCVSPSTSSTYAPSTFAKHPKAEGISKAAFQKAMDRLLGEGLIRVEVFGSPSKLRQKLIVTTASDIAGSVLPADENDVGEN